MEKTESIAVVLELGSNGVNNDGVYSGECYLTFPDYPMLSVTVPDMSNTEEVSALIKRGIEWHDKTYAGVDLEHMKDAKEPTFYFVTTKG